MMTNMRSNRNKAHLGLGALLLGLSFIAWLVLLGGVASVQKLGELLQALFTFRKVLQHLCFMRKVT